MGLHCSQMLSPYRVIDLTDEGGLLCGQILADLGADVIQIEPPGGARARDRGPFAGDQRDAEGSLFWWAYARNKRSLVLDIETENGRNELLRLLRGADFFIESETPGRLESLGLDHASLSALNPGLIHVSITPFGSTGPKAQWASTDLVAIAAGGSGFLSGEGERPPMRVCVPQAHAHAGSDAAVGALLALHGRRTSGRGQHVDISAQDSLTLATMYRSLDAPLEEALARRQSGVVYIAGIPVPIRYPLADGWVILGPAWLPSTGHFMLRLLEWMHEQGECDAALLEEDWGTYAFRMMSRELGREDFEPVDRQLADFFATRTRAEVMEQVIARKLLVAPVLGIDEIIEGEQLRARDFPVEMTHPKTGVPALYPGPFARFTARPIHYRWPPPRLGEHNEAIRSEPERPPVEAKATKAGLPLEGVKILDLFWILAGPGATRMLADYGATVVHVETTKHPDTLRLIPPYRFNNPHPEGAGGFQSAKANKLGLSLDLSSEAGRKIVLELVKWCDVVTESFAPGVMASLGFDYESLRKLNPDLIMISSCLMGQTGPWKDFAGFGNLAASVTGFQGLAQWPDAPPSGPYGAYTDFISVRYNALSILAALEHRALTGEGQYIDQAQAESALHFVSPAFLDSSVNSRAPTAVGNRDLESRPHGIFPCAGEEKWIAIAVTTDAQWRALCEAMKRPDLLDERDAGEGLDQEIEAWTQKNEGAELEARLQAAGVPAHRVLDTAELYACPQLAHRGHYIDIECAIYQSTTVESSRILLSESEARRPTTALQSGRDNRYVLETLLGHSPEQIAELAAKGVLL
ncbi:MAG: CoA transferase [Myxococcota bacterium]